MFFIITLAVLIVISVVACYLTRSSSVSRKSKEFAALEKQYLIVYLLAAAADWLQGPHIYVLYNSYGIVKHDIELLFVAGFGSSLLFGTFIGALADTVGRRLICVLYGILYGGACITKHFGNFWILMVGRVFGGISTSILFSSFESWLVCEHRKRGFEDQSLKIIFSNAVLGNAVIAIISGVSAQLAADNFGYVAPFDISLITLIVMVAALLYFWTENYGDTNATLRSSFSSAFAHILKDRRIVYLCLVQSLFEGCMYTFILEWTPVLTLAAASNSSFLFRLADSNCSSTQQPSVIPHGYIFSAFMVSIVIGSSLFKCLAKRIQPQSFLRMVLLIAAACMLFPIFLPSSVEVLFFAFIVFEVCIGIFFPAMGYLRSMYIPEEVRSTIMNLFRVPLNLIVILILFLDLPVLWIFSCCFGFLLCATVFQILLYR